MIQISRSPFKSFIKKAIKGLFVSFIFLPILSSKPKVNLAEKLIVADDIYRIRAVVSQWIADPKIQSILLTGGTGFTGRDSTPEAVAVLLDKTIEGFGELFRMLSYDEIGTSTVQSRALAGLANETLIFCMPGSTGACKTAWGKIIREQLDSRHQPCNFVGVLKARADQLDRC